MRSDDYLDDGDERDRASTGAIFASGWFRAVLVLGVLAITLVVTVPYLLRWMDPGQARIERQVARPVESKPAVAPTPNPAPVAPAATAPPVAPAPVQSTATPVPAAAPAATATPVPSPPAPAATPGPAPRPNAPAVASGPVSERLVPAPRPAPAGAERESMPARPSATDTGSRKAELAAKKVEGHERTPPRAAAAPTARGGDYWVQVGAFQHERNADALERSIRDKLKMPAQVSRPARAQTVSAAPSRHEVFVTGTPVTAVNTALHGQGHAQAVRGGVAVQPPLELKEAVALSRRLAGEGMTVKIRRVGGDAPAGDAQIAHVVRVGGYATRAQAEAARRELAKKGVNGFVTPAAHTAAVAPPPRAAQATPVAHTPAAR